jgi:hypothetical protein
MRGRVIQSSLPLRCGIEGMDMRDSRAHSLEKR